MWAPASVLLSSLSHRQKRAVLLTLRQLQRWRVACLVSSQAAVIAAGTLFGSGRVLAGSLSTVGSLALAAIYVGLAPETYYFWWDMEPAELDPRNVPHEDRAP